MELFEYCAYHFMLGCKVFFDEWGGVFSACVLILASMMMLGKMYRRGKR